MCATFGVLIFSSAATNLGYLEHLLYERVSFLALMSAPPLTGTPTEAKSDHVYVMSRHYLNVYIIIFSHY